MRCAAATARAAAAPRPRSLRRDRRRAAAPPLPPRADHKELWFKTGVVVTAVVVVPYTLFILYK